MEKLLIIFSAAILFISCKQTKTGDLFVEGVSDPILTLNGTWKISLNPPDEFWKLKIPTNEWKDIQVPGECMMQGFPIKHNEPFVYMKAFDVPLDFKNKTLILQFDGVYSYARVWVNGKYVRDHSGGFTRWTCDVTNFVAPGERAILTVEVTDKADEISYGSGYAKHQIGGILRDVLLLALPDNYPEDVTIKTNFDEDYQDAVLSISGKSRKLSGNAKINVELYDSNNENIALSTNSVSLNNSQQFQIKNKVASPLKWDAEHPNLYDLKISFTENDKLLWQKIYRIGFREINVQGNKLLVNGKVVKLRGANRHDIHPLLGRVSTPEYELKDVLLAKEANMNFIRTSHYPPTNNFLSLCDEYGIYVEDETAACFVGSHRTEAYYPGSTENEPAYTERYLSQLEEMMSYHKNHPSVLIWSIGNENFYGINFKKSYDFVKKYDDTRPVIFSYPGYVPDSICAYDILSMHYPGISGNLVQLGKETKEFSFDDMPVLFDEWAHVACYNNFTVMEDPNIRDFWGISIDSMWQRTFEAEGGLGGAIWCMIDETFMLPESLPGFNDWWGKIDKRVIPAAYSGHTIGYGEWGIVDTWRRKKPEFWNTKKAYTPVKILQTQFEQSSENEPLEISVYNRFDHTNINELTIRMEYNGEKTALDPPSIEPHSKGELRLPETDWGSNEPVLLAFYDKQNNLIDKYQITLKAKAIAENVREHSEDIHIEEAATSISVVCENETKIIFDKTTGLMIEIQNPEANVPLSGPVINLRTKGKAVMYSYHEIDDHSTGWLLESFNYAQADGFVNIDIKGSYEHIGPVEYNINVFQNGKLSVKYNIGNVPQEFIREAGIKFSLSDVFDSISWDRDPYWSYYPADHLSSGKGITALYSDNPKIYRNVPKKSWSEDSKSFYYSGTVNEVSREALTNIAKSTKERILSYDLMIHDQPFISVVGHGDVSCRLAKTDNTIQLFANNETDYVDLSWGNFQRNIKLKADYSNEIVVKFNTHATKL